MIELKKNLTGDQICHSDLHLRLRAAFGAHYLICLSI